MILLLDPHARAGRTGHRLRVQEAKRLRMDARHALGASHSDTPDVETLLAAAAAISTMLHDASEGDARLLVRLGKGTDADREYYPPAAVLSTLKAG